MILTTFCNTYIIAECVLLKSILSSMPRYRTGQHRGIQVIREYSGTGKNRIEKEFQSNSRDFEQAQKNLELYEQLSKTLKEYEYELKKRNLTIPADFRLKTSGSAYDTSAWELLESCSNSYENKNNYRDDYGYNVKSRGEMIVGSALKSLGLEAKYEPKLILKGGRKKTPDYSFPVRIIDRCFFVEFMGKADDEGYIDYNHGKLEEYMRNGILPMRDLILITGTENWMPSQEEVMRTIAYFINNAVLSVYGTKYENYSSLTKSLRSAS